MTQPPPTTPTQRFGVRLRNAGALTLLIVAVLAAAQAYVVYANVLVNKGDFTWDPAHHSLWGLLVYQDIERGNWISFALDSYRQIYWPFLQSWFIAAFMLVLGPTAVAARLVSLVAYTLTAVMLAAIVRRTVRKHATLAVVVTMGLWLTMGRFVVEFAADAFTETLAMAMTAASVWTFAWALEGERRLRFFWAGVLSLAAYLTKTGYGIVLVPAVLIALFSAARRGELDEGPKKIVAYLLGVSIPAAVWFAYPPKILVTIDALINNPYGPQEFPAWLLFDMTWLYRWCDSPWAFAALIASLLTAMGRSGRRNTIVTALVAYSSIAIVLHTLSATNSDKHITKVLPWLFVIAGWQVARLWDWLGSRPLAARWRTAVAVILAMAGVFRVHDFLAEVAGFETSDPAEIRAAVVERIDAEHSYVILGENSAVSPHLIAWHVLTENLEADIVPDPINTSKASFRKEALNRRVENYIGRYPVLRAFERGGATTIYHIDHAYAGEASRGDPATVLDALLDDLPDHVLLLEFAPESPWQIINTAVAPTTAEEFRTLLAARPAYVERSMLEFPEGHVRLRIYDRVPPV